MDSSYLYIVLVIIALSVGVFFKIKRYSIKGSLEEKKVAILLKRLGDEYKIYNDIIIETSYGTTQVDHIVVSKYGIFVIETKNYKGLIFGSEKSDVWTQNIWGNKFEFKNPLHQNYGHIMSLKQLLPLYNAEQYVSIVVFSSRANLKMKVNGNNVVVKDRVLLQTIRSYSQPMFTVEQVHLLCEQLNRFASISKSKSLKKEHVKSVKMKKENAEAMRKNRICPRCGCELIVRKGIYGSFYGCSNYPKCKYTSKL